MTRQLGTETAATANAISLAIPILLGGLSTNAADADGAAALDTAISANNHPAILAHILGTRRGAVEEGIGRATGLTAQKVAELLTQITSLITGVLARMKSQEDVGVDELPVVLGQANLDLTRQSAAIGDLSRVLASEPGAIADEVVRIGSSIVSGMLGRETGS